MGRSWISSWKTVSGQEAGGKHGENSHTRLSEVLLVSKSESHRETTSIYRVKAVTSNTIRAIDVGRIEAGKFVDRGQIAVSRSDDEPDKIICLAHFYVSLLSKEHQSAALVAAAVRIEFLGRKTMTKEMPPR